MEIRTETVVGIFVLCSMALAAYLIFMLGVFRPDRFSYQRHSIYFYDVSGLEKKADVKISGVKVGWVEHITLLDKQGYQARADIMVHMGHPIYTNARAMVRQETILGTKYLDLYPGDSMLTLNNEGIYGRAPVSIDEILYSAQHIAFQVKDITTHLQGVVNDPQAQEQVKGILAHLHTTAENFASVSTSIDRIILNNEETINTILSQVKDLMTDAQEVMPTVKEGMEDFKEITGQTKVDLVMYRSIATRLYEGKGFLGKLFKCW